jgi:hypothetical protein
MWRTLGTVLLAVGLLTACGAVSATVAPSGAERSGANPTTNPTERIAYATIAAQATPTFPTANYRGEAAQRAERVIDGIMAIRHDCDSIPSAGCAQTVEREDAAFREQSAWFRTVSVPAACPAVAAAYADLIAATGAIYDAIRTAASQGDPESVGHGMGAGGTAFENARAAVLAEPSDGPCR